MERDGGAAYCGVASREEDHLDLAVSVDYRSMILSYILTSYRQGIKRIR